MFEVIKISERLKSYIGIVLGAGASLGVMMYSHMTLFGLAYDPFSPVMDVRYGVLEAVVTLLLSVPLLLLSRNHKIDFSCVLPFTLLFFAYVVAFLSSFSSVLELTQIVFFSFTYAFLFVFLIGKWFKVLADCKIDRAGHMVLFALFAGLIIASVLTYLNGLILLIVIGLITLGSMMCCLRFGGGSLHLSNLSLIGMLHMDYRVKRRQCSFSPCLG